MIKKISALLVIFVISVSSMNLNLFIANADENIPSTFHDCVLNRRTQVCDGGWEYYIKDSTGTQYANGTSINDPLWIHMGVYADASDSCQAWSPVINVNKGSTYTGSFTIETNKGIGNSVTMAVFDAETGAALAYSETTSISANQPKTFNITYYAKSSGVRLHITSGWVPPNSMIKFSADNVLEREGETTTRDPSIDAIDATVGSWQTIGTNGWSYFLRGVNSKYKNGESMNNPLHIFYGDYVSDNYTTQVISPKIHVKGGKEYNGSMKIKTSDDIGASVYVRVYNADTYVMGGENVPIASSKLYSIFANTEGFEIPVSYTVPQGCRNVYLLFTSGWTAQNSHIELEAKNEAVQMEDVLIQGYQISAEYGGFRVVGSMEPTINDLSVVEKGLIYGLSKVNGKDIIPTGLNDENEEVQMVINTPNPDFVMIYPATEKGILSDKLGKSDTATYIARTMKFGKISKGAFVTEYKVRAYAKLSNGEYVYSDVETITIEEIAETLYKNSLMNTLAQHNYLYNTILKTVNPMHNTVEYQWNRTIVKPEDIGM